MPPVDPYEMGDPSLPLPQSKVKLYIYTNTRSYIDKRPGWHNRSARETFNLKVGSSSLYVPPPKSKLFLEASVLTRMMIAPRAYFVRCIRFTFLGSLFNGRGAAGMGIGMNWKGVVEWRMCDDAEVELRAGGHKPD